MGTGLLKSEPETYAFSQLLKDKKTNWDHVRNFQARNTLKTFAVGDLMLIYHSGDERAVVGLARVTREAYPDPDPEHPGDWVQIDLEAIAPLAKPVPLSALKNDPALANLPLIRQSRLSCMTITQAEFKRILALGATEVPKK